MQIFRHVLPVLASDNKAYRTACDSIYFCNTFIRVFARHIFFSDRQNDFISQFCHSMLFTFRSNIATSRLSVCVIVKTCSWSKMFRVTARRIVATVQSVVRSKVFASRERQRNTVRSDLSRSADAEFTVPVFVARQFPRPTRIIATRFIDMRPKTFSIFLRQVHGFIPILSKASNRVRIPENAERATLRFRSLASLKNEMMYTLGSRLPVLTPTSEYYLNAAAV